MTSNTISLTLQAVSTALLGAWAVREWWAERSRAAVRRARARV